VNDLLSLVVDGWIMGEVRRDRRGRLTLVYDPHWRTAPGAWPLSLSMPLVVAEHEHGRIDSWLRGLLPASEVTLERWGRQFHASPRDAFALLSAVGEDCAGAVQLVPPHRIPVIADSKPMTVEWLTRAGMAERLRALRKDPAAARLARDGGHCSLGGRQAKTALVFNGQHWGIPSGRTPTTHILKLPVEGLDGHVHNEHLCLALARALGLPVARSQVLAFEDQAAIVLERYDRWRDGGTVRRLHQEDLGQALGRAPSPRRGNGAGTRPARMLEVIRAHSGEPQQDMWTFARALMLNWLIAGGEALANNFSLLIGAGGRVRLAPLRNLVSTLPWPAADTARHAPATSGGTVHAFDEIGIRHWMKFATEARLPATQVLEAARDMAARIPDVLAQVTAQARAEGVNHPIVMRLADLLSARAERCARLLAG
jgi:serine/threonine-protein kinase HipA